jgi:hypothetical protein
MADNPKKTSFIIFASSRLKYENAKQNDKDQKDVKEMVEKMYNAFVNLNANKFTECLKL